jgi:hypothetical protein
MMKKVLLLLALTALASARSIVPEKKQQQRSVRSLQDAVVMVRS